MTDIKASMQDVYGKITAANEAARSDQGASPVLLAVVGEFAKKADKAKRLIDEGKGTEAVIELEQAGDSAKAAAEADTAAGEDTTKKVLDAHLAICMLKNSLDGS